MEIYSKNKINEITEYEVTEESMIDCRVKQVIIMKMLNILIV